MTTHSFHPAHSRVVRSLARAAIASCAAAFFCGCSTTETQTQGSSRTAASYSFPSLSASLPEHVTPQAVAAAAEQALRQRGYSITSSTSTSDSARVVARAPNTGPLKKIIVRASWTRTGSTVSVTERPLGDDVRARAVLDGLLANLGL